MPGEHIVSEEEYSATKNVFARDGEIYSNSVGVPEFDFDQRKVRVKAIKEIKGLKKGDIVLARVLFKRKNMVGVEILSVESREKERIVFPKKQAVILIRDVSNKFVKNLDNEFKIGDIIRAKVVLNEKFAVNLKTNEPGLGVIKAVCFKCRETLKKSNGFLYCTKCKSREYRKISSEYILKGF